MGSSAQGRRGRRQPAFQGRLLGLRVGLRTHQPAALRPPHLLLPHRGGQRHVHREPLRHQFVGLPFGAGSPHLLQRLGAVPDRPQQLPPLGPAELGLRQRAQVEVAPGRHEGAGGQRGHLAVAHVGPAAHPEGLLHRLDGRDIQRIVRRVAGHDGRGQRQAQRIEDGRRDLELGSVGVVLAVAELQEPLLGQDVGVGVGGGGVDADEVGGELVDADGLLVQVALQGAEGVAGAESGEPVGEAVVVGVGGPDGFAQEGGEGALVLGDPGLDVVEAVVPLGDEEEEPDGQDLARGERALSSGAGRGSGGPGWPAGPDAGRWPTGRAGRPRLRHAASGVRWCSSLQSTHRPPFPKTTPNTSEP